MNIPDFFIIGAPKCGTTSLYRYLECHPNVYMSRVKEPNYFCYDLPGIRQVTSPEKYSALFDRAQSGQIRGEGSTSYLSSKSAIKSIVELKRETKMIAMIRNPVDMVISYHGQKIYTFEETEHDFRKAWYLSDKRSHGLYIPPKCKAPMHLDYKMMGRLGEQLRNVIDLIGRDQLHVIVFDDFVADTKSAFRGALEFLSLPPIELERFPAANARRRHSLPTVAKLFMKPPDTLNWLKEGLKQRFPAQTKMVGNTIYRSLRRDQKQPEIRAELKKDVAKEFAADIDLLSKLTNRDLSHWYRYI